MSDSRFDHIYDPVATPNPAYDDDFEPSPAPATSWDRRDLAQALLHRARARQEAIADAFVDALLDGKIALFRILLELEQASITSLAEAEDARRPGLADILLPMLQRERAQAAANAAQNEAQNEDRNHPGQTHETTRHIHSLSAPANPGSEESAPPQPGITDIQATASPTCRSQTVDHNHRRARTRIPAPRPYARTGSPETLRPAHPENQRRVTQVSILKPAIPGILPFTLRTLHAVAAEVSPEIRIPLRFKSYGTRHPRRRISRCNSLKQKELHA